MNERTANVLERYRLIGEAVGELSDLGPDSPETAILAAAIGHWLQDVIAELLEPAEIAEFTAAARQMVAEIEQAIRRHDGRQDN